MAALLAAVFFLFALHSTTRPALSKPDPQNQEFLTDCPPTSCGSLQIRFPLKLRSSAANCGPESLELTCHGNDTFLSAPSFPSPFRVTAINYRFSRLTVDIGSGYGSETCPLRNPANLTRWLATPTYTPVFVSGVSMISCSERFAVTGSDHVAGPMSCLSGPGYYVYAVDDSESMDVVPIDCMVVKTGGEIPYALDADYAPEYSAYSSYTELLDAFLKRREVTLRWYVPGISDMCSQCEEAGGLCGFSQGSHSGFCKSSHHG